MRRLTRVDFLIHQFVGASLNVVSLSSHCQSLIDQSIHWWSVTSLGLVPLVILALATTAIGQKDHATQQNSALIEEMSAASTGLIGQTSESVAQVAFFKLDATGNIDKNAVRSFAPRTLQTASSSAHRVTCRDKATSFL